MTKYQYSQLGHNIKYSDGVISLATSSKIELFRYPIIHLLFSASAMCFLKTQGSQRSTHTRARAFKWTPLMWLLRPLLLEQQDSLFSNAV